MPSLIDFAIVTALEVERKAVCTAFGLGDQHRVKRDSRVYWRGRCELGDGEAYQLVVAQSLDAANVDMALLTNDALHHWKPGAALLLGIAASTHEDVHSGDIVLGSDVHYFEREKVLPEGKAPEPKIIPPDATMWANAMALPDWEEPVPVARPDRTARLPAVHRGVIACGEKVVASAAARDKIASGNRKILAIEMEGYGFSRAVWQSFDQVRHLVVRAITDAGDESKADDWHEYASTVVSCFARHFLCDRPLPPRSTLTTPTTRARMEHLAALREEASASWDGYCESIDPLLNLLRQDATEGTPVGIVAQAALSAVGEVNRRWHAERRKANIRINLSGLSLLKANLAKGDYQQIDFTGAKLNGACLDGANLEDAVLVNADLTRASLKFTILRDVDLRGATLDDANLTWADLKGATFEEALMNRAILDHAKLSSGNGRRAKLNSARMRGARMTACDLRDAELREADLTGAFTTAVNFCGADLTGIVGLLYGTGIQVSEDTEWAGLAKLKAEKFGDMHREAIQSGDHDQEEHALSLLRELDRVRHNKEFNQGAIPLDPDQRELSQLARSLYDSHKHACAARAWDRVEALTEELQAISTRWFASGRDLDAFAKALANRYRAYLTDNQPGNAAEALERLREAAARENTGEETIDMLCWALSCEHWAETETRGHTPRAAELLDELKAYASRSGATLRQKDHYSKAQLKRSMDGLLHAAKAMTGDKT